MRKPTVRKKIRHDENTRAKIQAAHIIRRFQQCLDGEIELTPVQVTCGKTLLAKILPDLQSVSHEGEITHSYVAELPARLESVEEWQQTHKLQ